MKRIIAIALGLLASLASVGSASGQDNAAKVAIPFGFYIGGQWNPSGSYTLTSNAKTPYVISVRNAQGRISQVSLAHASDPQSHSNTLVFTRYGDQYFLHEIHCSACRLNVAFNDSKRERAAQIRETNLARSAEVYIALR
jgi:hypothetical protein